MFKGLQKNMARMQQKAMAAMGKAEATVDAEFDQHAANFKEQYAKTKKLSKFVRNYEKAVAAQNGIAQMVMDQYESHQPMYGAAVKYEKLSQEVEALRHTLEQKFEEGFHQPLADYLGQYKLAEARIEERQKRLLDMDKAKYDLKCLMEKGQSEPTRIQMAKEREEMATAAYLALNAELLRDLPILTSDRANFFSSLFANVVDGQMMYFQGYLSILGQMEPVLSTVDRFEHRGHRWCITDESQSAMRRGSVTPGDAAAQPAYQPPASQPPSYQQPAAAQPAYQPPASQPPSYQQPAAAPVAAAAAAQPYTAPPPAAPAAVHARALYQFVGQDHTELSFEFNDILIIHRQSGEWWEGEINGRRGLFPANYVQLL